MAVMKVVRKSSSVLPPKHPKAPLQTLDSSSDDEPVLPRRDPSFENIQSSVYLPRWLWEALEQISASTALPGKPGDKKERREYSRNEVIEYFLVNRVEAWKRERKSPKK